jgi:hypothetical protein
VSIAGRAREGPTALSAQFEAFVQGLKKGLPPETALRDRPSPNGSKFTVDLCSLAPPETVEEAPAGGATKDSAQKDAAPKDASPKETGRKSGASREKKSH